MSYIGYKYSDKQLGNLSEGMSEAYSTDEGRLKQVIKRTGKVVDFLTYGYHYYHRRASKMYRRDKCYMCGLTEEDNIKKHKRILEVHNLAGYKILEPWNWVTFCRVCHPKVDLLFRRLKNHAEFQIKS
jgi:glycerol-3-phosphate cytidylyltransferase-like family protein